VTDIVNVINYDFPSCTEDHVHRIGRTGRVDKQGNAYTFFTSANGSKAKELVKIMEEAHQPVPPQLREVSQMSSMMGHGRQRGGQRRWRTDDGASRKRAADDSFGDAGGKRAKVAQNGWR